MEQDREKVAIEEKLERCRELAAQFPDGVTARHIKELQDELKMLLDATGAKTSRR